MAYLMLAVVVITAWLITSARDSLAESPRDVSYFFSKRFAHQTSFYANYGRRTNYKNIVIGGNLVIWEGMLVSVMADAMFVPEKFFRSVNIFFPEDNPNVCKEAGQCWANIVLPTSIVAGTGPSSRNDNHCCYNILTGHLFHNYTSFEWMTNFEVKDLVPVGLSCDVNFTRLSTIRVHGQGRLGDMFSPVEQWIEDEVSAASVQITQLINDLSQQILGGIESVQSAIVNQTTVLSDELTGSTEQIESGMTSLKKDIIYEVAPISNYYHTAM